ncbi:hypothetical protein C8R45DRAFT_1095611 [Mycena sanguinolenta]|nr:hypothetical protein C8R45DRAFT_1095611 [Mycena sanguinolenta]
MCIPPFHPCPGHEDRERHDNSAVCTYHVVFKGWVRGIYTNSWIARAQTDGYTGSICKSFKTMDPGLDWWDNQCDVHHQGRCPDFEPVIFSLVADPVRQPGPPPCSGTPLVSASTPSIPAAPSPFNTPSPLLPTPSLFASTVKKEQSPEFSPHGPHVKIEQPSSSTPKKNSRGPSPSVSPRVTPGTCVSLTPAGLARANLLQAHANLQSVPETPPRPRAPVPSVVVTPAAPHGVAGSVLTTPIPRAAPAPAPAPAPPAPAPPAPAPVPLPVPAPLELVTDPDTGACAAKKLGLEDGKIMVSSNVDKVEAWMTNQPFVGDDA